MAKHQTRILTADERETANLIVRTVGVAMESNKRMEVHYIKRDGSASRLVGEPVSIQGVESTQSVTFSTDRGYRSVNTYAVTGWWWTSPAPVPHLGNEPDLIVEGIEDWN